MPCPTTILSQDLMIRIFHFLTPKPLKTVMLVCKSWMEMAEDPTLWTWAIVTVNSREDYIKLKISRMKKIQEIRVNEWYTKQYHEYPWKYGGDMMELFQLMVTIPTLTTIHGVEFHDLFNVERRLLATVFNRLEYINLVHQLTVQQQESLFTALGEKETNVKTLIVDSDVSEVRPTLFASAVTNIHEVMLINDEITREQVKAVFVRINEGGKALKKLYAQSCIINYAVEPRLITTAANILEEFTTDYYNSDDQYETDQNEDDYATDEEEEDKLDVANNYKETWRDY